MKLYNALIKQDKNGKIEDIALLEDGFSWMALFLSIPWFLFHKMWRNSLILIAINILFFFLEEAGFFSKLDLIFLETSFFLLVAFNANYWFDEHLRSHDYQAIGYVLAQNKVEARIKAMRILDHNYPNLSFESFSEAIVDPKAYGEILKIKKKEPYFSA